MRLDLKLRSVLFLAMLLAATSTVSAANSFLVTNLDDAGIGSLRQAILNANAAGGNPTITFSTAPGTLFSTTLVNTITVSSGELYITTALTIQGLVPAKLIVSGTHASRVFNIDPGVGNAVNISGLTVSDGLPKSTAPFGGAGILVSSGTLERDGIARFCNSPPSPPPPVSGPLINSRIDVLLKAFEGSVTTILTT